MAEPLADRLFAEDRVEAMLLEAECLLPVPLHALRQLSRGYNQAELIASRLSGLTGLPVVNPVVRCRATEAQTHLHSHRRRMSNLKGAFRLTHPEQIEGRDVVVIDDVMTTGATLQTLARAIKPAKPKRIRALVIGRADPRHGES